MRAHFFPPPMQAQDEHLLRVQPAHPHPPGGAGLAGRKWRRRSPQGTNGDGRMLIR